MVLPSAYAVADMPAAMDVNRLCASPLCPCIQLSDGCSSGPCRRQEGQFCACNLLSGSEGEIRTQQAASSSERGLPPICLFIQMSEPFQDKKSRCWRRTSRGLQIEKDQKN